jgi:hypothetical protein
MKAILVPLIVLGLAGCASGIETKGDVASSQLVGPNLPVRAVTISFTPEAQNELADNLKFNQNVLVDHVVRALQARSEFNAANASAESIEIQMTNIRIRSNFNAFMFGFMAGADKLEGDVYLRDPSGKVVNQFSVYADYALGGIAGANDEARMGWLYDKFSQLLIQHLLGMTTS